MKSFVSDFSFLHIHHISFESSQLLITNNVTPKIYEISVHAHKFDIFSHISQKLLKKILLNVWSIARQQRLHRHSLYTFALLRIEVGFFLFTFVSVCVLLLVIVMVCIFSWMCRQYLLLLAIVWFSFIAQRLFIFI